MRRSYGRNWDLNVKAGLTVDGDLVMGYRGLEVP